MKKVCFILILALGFSGASQAAPKNIRSHALAKTVVAAGVVVKNAPKFSLKAIVKSIGGIVFTVEEGVDVVHAGTFALETAAKAELKHGYEPFEYVNKGVAYADTGLEKTYKFFWNADI